MDFKNFLTNNLETKSIPWSNPEFSQRSLKLHLDQEHDVNSRRQFIIDKQTNWIHSFILKGNTSKILELACGPGLYLSNLAEFGHQCTGIDISPAVIDYAKANSQSTCNFHCEDILSFSTEKKFDLIFINFGWFHNFIKEDASILLEKFKTLLNPNGRLLMELLPFDVIQSYGEESNQWHKTDSGIFSNDSYLFLQENHWLEEEKLANLNYYIFDDKNIIQAYNQKYQAYNDDDLEKFLNVKGFTNFQYFSNVCDEDDFADDLYFLLCQKL